MSRTIIKKGTRELLAAAKDEARLLGVEVEWETQGESKHPKLIIMHGDKMVVVPFSTSPRTDNQAIRGRQSVRQAARQWGLCK